jgi:hypothetical protein
MTVDRLDVIEFGRYWCIAWIIDGDTGALLGEPLPDDDHRAATAAAKGAAIDALVTHGPNNQVLHWESERAARVALRVARAAVRAFRDGRPLPGWAKKALAAGWRAPKGWKP